VEPPQLLYYTDYAHRFGRGVAAGFSGTPSQMIGPNPIHHNENMLGGGLHQAQNHLDLRHKLYTPANFFHHNFRVLFLCYRDAHRRGDRLLKALF